MDTIAAISTPMGEGAIGIIRLSGKKAINIVNKLFQGADLSKVESHSIHYGVITDPNNNNTVDEVLISVMRGPKTFTREDIIEINCHGGLLVTNRMLEVMLMEGARLAEPGEFTKRAFLNGRIDLSQAEAVMDLIKSKTNEAMNVALNQLDGKLSRKINLLRQQLLETIAHVEVNIDYPEYDDVEEMSHQLMQEKTVFVHDEIKKLLAMSREGKILRDGIKTAIIGRPNVGKSSLLNSLVQEDKAIVTDIPGTTRDIIEEYVNIRGIPLKLIDTAGIRETEDAVEKIGVERSRKIIDEADLILYVLNYNEPLTDEDKQIFSLLKNKNYLILLNKYDLEQKIDINELTYFAEENSFIYTSMTLDKGIDELGEAIYSMYLDSEDISYDQTFVSNVRHIDLLTKGKVALEDAMNALEIGIPLDVVQIDVTRTWDYLGEIVGETVGEQLVDQLFSQFCLGK